MKDENYLKKYSEQCHLYNVNNCPRNKNVISMYLFMFWKLRKINIDNINI